MLPVGRMILVVLPASSLSLFNLFEDRYVAEGPGALAEVYQPVEPVRVHPHARREEAADATSLALMDDTALPSSPSDVARKTRRASREVAASGEPAVWNWPVIFGWLWLAGCALSCSYWIGMRLLIARVLANSRAVDERISDYLKGRSRELGIRRAVRCVVVEENLGPATIGVFRPSILLPAALLRELPAESITKIIEHELQHVQVAYMQSQA